MSVNNMHISSVFYVNSSCVVIFYPHRFTGTGVTVLLPCSSEVAMKDGRKIDHYLTTTKRNSQIVLQISDAQVVFGVQ